MKIKVEYWRGTTKLQGIATTYQGALRIANRNQNAFLPRFYDEKGIELYDIGFGLAYLTNDKQIVCAV